MRARHPVSRAETPLRVVILAGEVGFCFGVKRAITMAEDALVQDEPVYIHGDLVHNRNVTDDLESRGLQKVRSLEGRPRGSVVVRAHGLPRTEVEEAKEAGYRIIDATCPIVLRAQEAAQMMEARGCQVVIIGDAHHAEIKGIIGALRHPALVIDTVEQLRNAKATRALRRKVGVIFQTTHALELCKDIVGELVFMCKEVQIVNTICRPVQNRQDAALSVAEDVDMMLVVGSPTSANTMELTALCHAHNPWTRHIEGAEGLRDEDLCWAHTIGIASGLSTPVHLIDEVRSAILARTDEPDFSRRPPREFYELRRHGG